MFNYQYYKQLIEWIKEINPDTLLSMIRSAFSEQILKFLKINSKFKFEKVCIS